MLDIPGYKIIEKIYDGRKAAIYKGIREKDDREVAIKTLKTEYPTINEVYSFEQEYRIMTRTAGEGIVKPIALEKHKNIPIIVMEYINGSSLNVIYESRKSSLKEFLEIAIESVEKIASVHDNNIIHKDINLSNIMWNSTTKKATIIDFGIATELTKENQEIVHPDRLEGTLIYISPEQTGRMNRSIDYRTDYYSLGVSFYKMVTGVFPFFSNDPVELVHSHIARKPVPPFEVDTAIPHVISQIIMKLLEKTAEKRYQSSSGLLNDLKHCYNKISETNIITEFAPGENDISHKFQIPEKLYGRENEINSLMNIFEHTANGYKETVFLPGASGIGKTALINEINKPIVKKRGYFISGKYDQYKRNLPYTAIIEAVSALVKQLLTEKKEKLALWKKNILKALNDKGKVIIDVIPELELIIGVQPDVEILPPMEAQNRFNMLFQDFISVFKGPDHPLVLFIDDLQWADLASLNLLYLLITNNDLVHFLFIGAFRDNEVSTGHPLSSMLDRLQKEGQLWHRIEPQALKIDNINQLLSETLLTKQQKTLPLAELVFQKTGGNPFFVLAFIRSLYEKDFITFDKTWKWDIKMISQSDITDNVIKLMAGKIQLLKEETLSIIKLACCVGVQIDLDILSVICKITEIEIYEALKEALIEGFVLRIENTIKFAHDKIREATYSIMSEDEQKQLHYSIGIILLDKLLEHNSPVDPFIVVNQLNSAQKLLKEDEKDKVINLNFEAGQKAKESSAFYSATQFFRKGAGLLADDIWSSDYKKALQYFSEWAEAEFLAANSLEAEGLFEEVKNNAKDIFDKEKIIFNEIDHYTNQMKLNEAIDVGLDALKQLGISFPSEIAPDFHSNYLEKINKLLENKKLSDLEEMTDSKQQLIVNVIVRTIMPAYMAGHQLLFALILEGTTISLTYGNTPISSMLYSLFSIACEVLTRDYETVYNFSKFGKELAEKYNSKFFLGKAYHVFSWFSPWKHHLNENLDILYKSFNFSLVSGDNQRAGIALLCWLFTHILIGENLEEISRHYDTYLHLYDKIGQPQFKAYVQIWQCGVLSLSGKSKHKLTLKSNGFDEEEILKVYEQTNDVTGKSYIGLVKLILAYYFEDYDEALVQAEIAEANINGLIAQTIEKTFYFFYALSLVKKIDKADPESKKTYMEKLSSLTALYKGYADQCPCNYEHKYNLILAETARIQGNEMKEVTELYNKAIEGAQENEFLHEEAIANECAAQYYLSIDLKNIAKLYIREAYYCYQRWGALPKISMLEKNYSDMLPKQVANKLLTTVSTTSSGVMLGSLDLHSILKASQALSGEIELSRLLEKMMKYVIENAGAEKGFFLLKKQDDYFIEAEADVNIIQVLQSIPVEQTEESEKKVSPAIIHYVSNSKETIVLDNASSDNRFSNDSYIKQKNVSSVLCMPLINKGLITGILYLENNIAPGAFTEEHINVLQLMSSQMAISVENARMYGDLDDLNKNLDLKVKDRTKELQQTLTELQQTQDQLVESEKLAALGQLTAGVSHEINTPLGAIRSSIESISSVVTNTIPELPIFLQTLPEDLYPLFLQMLKAGVEKKRLSAREERKIKKDIRAFFEENGMDDNIEVVLKLLAMGISDTVANYLPILQSPLRNKVLGMAHKLSTIAQNTKIILSAVTKASKVAFALKNYSHFDHTGQKARADIKETIETVLTLYNNQIKQGIEIIRNFEDIPPVHCYPDELNQVWTNIIHNAIQAMDNKGILEIKLSKRDKSVHISFKDNGMGIADSVKAQIFNPFFTTRGLGEGSGLGLSIVKKIIDKHGGKIEVESSQGNGATFTIILPYNE